MNGHQVDAKSRWATFDRKDISDQMTVGKNVIDVTVTAPDAPDSEPNAVAKTTTGALAALVKITRSKGEPIRIPTNADWKASSDNAAHWQAAQVVADLTDNRLGDPGQLPQPAAYLRRSLVLSKTYKAQDST